MNSLVELGTATNAIREITSENCVLLVHSFTQAFSTSVKQYKILQSADRKGVLSFCYISYLRSSVIDRFPLFRIDLYDEDDLCDFEECSSEWDVGFLTAQIYQDIPMVIKVVSASTDLREDEIEQRWICEAEKYFAAIGEEIAVIIQPVRQKCASGVKFYYGEFLGKSSAI